MKPRTTHAAALITGGLLLATAACGGSSYALADGTPVPSWANDVVRSADPEGTLHPEQVAGVLYGGSLACVIPGSTLKVNPEFCTKIDPWLAKNAPMPSFSGMSGGSEPTPTPQPIVKGWNETARHSSGVEVTVSAPTPLEPSNSSSVPADEVMTTVEVTVVNNTGSTYEHPGFTETRTDKGAATTWASADYDGAPQTMLPGDKVTYTEEISVKKGSTELRLEWATGSLPGGQTAWEGLHFRGPLS